MKLRMLRNNRDFEIKPYVVIKSVVDDVVVGEQLNQEDAICVKRIVRNLFGKSTSARTI